MSTSDTIASAALIISLVSFWLSYRAARLSKTISAAEKRTQAHSILIGVLLEAEELLSLVQIAVCHKGTDFSFPEELGVIEQQLVTMTERIPKRLSWLRNKDSDDPVLLEEYKAFALEVESRIKRVAPLIRNMRVRQIEATPSLTT